MINQLKAKSCIPDSTIVGTFIQDLRTSVFAVWMRMWTVQNCAVGKRDYWICQERGGTANTLQAWTLQNNSPCTNSLSTSVDIWINSHVNMPKIRGSLRSWAKPQHSSARYFSPEAPALLATCIHLLVPLCSLNDEKGFFSRQLWWAAVQEPQEMRQVDSLFIIWTSTAKQIFLFLTLTNTKDQQEEGWADAAVWPAWCSNQLQE